MQIEIKTTIDTDRQDDRELLEQLMALVRQVKKLDNQELTQYNKHNKENL